MRDQKSTGYIMGTINEHKNVVAVAVFVKSDGSELRFKAQNKYTADHVRQIARERNLPYYERINGTLLSVEP